MGLGYHTIHAVSDGQKFAADHTLEVVTCPSCRMVYAIPASLVSSARAYPGNKPNGWTLVCPLGHDWHYTGPSVTGPSVTEKLEEERKRVQATRDLLEHEQRSHAATRGHLTRTKKRVGNGVCPCCNRTFQQLARHMESKHPDFVDREHGHLPGDPPKSSRRQGDLSRDILRVLGDGATSPAEIVEALGYSNANSVGVVLHRLRADGAVRHLGRARWTLA